MINIDLPSVAVEPETTETTPVLAPLAVAAPVVKATRGRQVFNDSDKDNYFEG
ncbi:hypothetical protein [Streptomyces sp. NPDC059122]|uniref:hypothetical protein n=1 Tax=unclassified Streptomyces TaxID=2593676 RepID=UPI0036758439